MPQLPAWARGSGPALPRLTVPTWVPSVTAPCPPRAVPPGLSPLGCPPWAVPPSEAHAGSDPASHHPWFLSRCTECEVSPKRPFPPSEPQPSPAAPPAPPNSPKAGAGMGYLPSEGLLEFLPGTAWLGQPQLEQVTNPPCRALFFRYFRATSASAPCAFSWAGSMCSPLGLFMFMALGLSGPRRGQSDTKMALGYNAMMSWVNWGVPKAQEPL